jgi:hypothetical protein
VAALATSFGRQVFERIVSAAHEEELWPALIAFSTELDPAPRLSIAKLIDQADDDVLDSLVEAVGEAGLEPELVGVLERLPAAGQRRLGKRIGALAPADLRTAITEAADDAGVEALAEALKPRPGSRRAA